MWAKLRKWVKDSETIAWARLQMIVGFIAGILTMVDPSLLSPVVPAEWLPWFLLLNGLATEYLRRRRDQEM